MLPNRKPFVLFEALLDFSTTRDNPAVSVATQRWLQNFTAELNFIFIGHENLKLFDWSYIRSRGYFSHNVLLGYWNMPVLRYWYLFLMYFISFGIKYFSNEVSNKIVIYACLNNRFLVKPSILAAYFLKIVFRTRVICIVADGQPPLFFDGYLFLSNFSYLKCKFENKVLFEGIIKDLNDEDLVKVEYLEKMIWNFRNSGKRIILYSGALDGHVSLHEFIKIFDKEIVRNNFHLVLTGYISDAKIYHTFLDKSFIDYLGLIDEGSLCYLASNCNILLNLRNDNVVNQYNFPSKLLFYFQFDKLVISSPLQNVREEIARCFYMVENDNSEDYLEAMLSVLANNIIFEHYLDSITAVRQVLNAKNLASIFNKL
jgi:hypothetical protein